MWPKSTLLIAIFMATICISAGSIPPERITCHGTVHEVSEEREKIYSDCASRVGFEQSSRCLSLCEWEQLGLNGPDANVGEAVGKYVKETYPAEAHDSLITNLFPCSSDWDSHAPSSQSKTDCQEQAPFLDCVKETVAAVCGAH